MHRQIRPSCHASRPSRQQPRRHASRPGAGVRVFGARLRTRAPADLRPRRHQPARRQAGDGLQPAVAPPARDRPPLVQRLPGLAAASARQRRALRMAAVRQRPDHQPDLVLSRGAPLRRPGARPARAPGARPAHLVRRRLHRRGALLDRHGGRRDAGHAGARRDRGQRHRHHGAGHRRARRLRRRLARPVAGAPAAALPARQGRQRGRIRVRPALAQRVELSRPQPDGPALGRWASRSTSCSAAT